MGMQFVGRERELAMLKNCAQRPVASLVVIHGRRRIGKSCLTDEFGKNKTYYHFTGIAPGPNITAQMQRDQFASRLGGYFSLPGLKGDDWADLFTVLAKECQQGEVILLLDEISWMGMHDPTFLGKLRNAWDREFKRNNQLMLILCGSISSWIEKNILTSTGFLGRVSQTIQLEELPLKDCFKFWGDNQNITTYEKLKYLSVTGGVPRYLEELNPKLTAEDNIRHLCFSPGGLLVKEFDNIFSDLFGKRSELYSRILELLINGPMEAKSISQALHVELTGWLSEHLSDLEKSGFIERDYTWNLKTGIDSRLSHFRLSDNYIRFYMKYMQKHIRKIERGDFHMKSLSSLPGWKMMLGYQFENLVLRNRKAIKEQLDIHPGELITDNPYFQRATTRQKGCQIDYLIQTKFHTLYVCEIKFRDSLIGPSIIKELQEKIEHMNKPRGFSCRPVLIHVNGVSDEVIDADYFAKVIDFCSLAES